MRPTLKRLIMILLAAVVLLPGVSNVTANAQHRHKRRPVRVIVVEPYYPTYFPVYEPIWEPYVWPTYVVAGSAGYLQAWGYREGRDEGKDDAEDGKLPNPTMHKDFYKSFSPFYRQAFIQGYYDGYRKEIVD